MSRISHITPSERATEVRIIDYGIRMDGVRNGGYYTIYFFFLEFLELYGILADYLFAALQDISVLNKFLL